MTLPQRYPKAVQGPIQFPQDQRKRSVTFTDQYLRGLKPSPEGRYEIFDAGTKHKKYPGFGIRVTPRGKKSFFILYRFGGKLKRWTIGEYPITSLREAREAVAKRRKDEDPAGEKTQNREAGSFVDLAKRFRREYVESDHIKRPLRPRTRYEYNRLLTKVLIPSFGNHLAAELSYQDVKRFLESKGQTRFEANRSVQVLSRLYSWARKERILQNDPTSGVDRYAEPPRQRLLKEAELRAILQAADSEELKYREATWWLLLHGSRPSELYSRHDGGGGMKWQDIDHDAREWLKPQTKTEAHLVPLTDTALKILDRMKPTRDQTDFVFARMRWDGLARRLRKRSGVENFRLYDLRSACATGMQRLEIDPDVIDRVEGRHPGGPRVRRAYQLHSYLKEKREALEKWHKEVARIYHG